MSNSSSPASTARRPPEQRSAFPHFFDVQTRWMDNDLYGHVNNVVYYSYFDTVINRYLVDHGALDIHASSVIGVSPETFCRFHKSFAYPDLIQGGLRVGKLGTSSVRYELALFAPGEDEARADGHFIHVFVTRDSQKPAPIPPSIRNALQRILV